MPYEGQEHYHFVSDVGTAFAMSAVKDFSGYDVFNLRGATLHSRDFLKRVTRIAAGSGRLSTADDAAVMPFVCDLDDTRICNAFPEMPLTNLDDGIRQSLETFRAQS